jgi:NADH:ubiquinone reductase (non-electrogenic)
MEMGDPSRGQKSLSMTGFSGWLAWRSAYLTRLGNTRNRLYVMMNWTMALLFGRDISRF